MVKKGNLRHERSLLFAVAIRRCEVYEQMKKVTLSSSDFLDHPALVHYGLILSALEKYFDEYREMPGEHDMALLLEKEIAEAPLLDIEAAKRARTLVINAYKMDQSSIKTETFLKPEGVLQRLVDDVKIKPMDNEIAREKDNKVRAEKRAALNELIDQTRVVPDVHEKIFVRENIASMIDDHTPVESGVDFIDKAILGFCSPCTIGMMAESGGGKTMMGVQIMAEQVIRGRNVMAFFYEQQIKGDIAKRIYSYGADLSRKELSMKYADLPPETKESLGKMCDMFAENCKVYDMSGSIKSQGTGGPLEIEAIIGREVRAGNHVDFALIDWLGPMVARHQLQGKQADINKKEKIDNALNELMVIGRRYNTTIFILHQLAPAIIEGKSPAFLPGWTTAHECKSFGLLLDYVFTFGRKCDDTNCMRFGVQKARGMPKSSRIVQMIGEENRIIDVTEGWGLSRNPRPGEYFVRRSGHNDQLGAMAGA